MAKIMNHDVADPGPVRILCQMRVGCIVCPDLLSAGKTHFPPRLGRPSKIWTAGDGKGKQQRVASLSHAKP